MFMRVVWPGCVRVWPGFVKQAAWTKHRSWHWQEDGGGWDSDKKGLSLEEKWRCLVVLDRLVLEQLVCVEGKSLVCGVPRLWIFEGKGWFAVCGRVPLWSCDNNGPLDTHRCHNVTMGSSSTVPQILKSTSTWNPYTFLLKLLLPF